MTRIASLAATLGLAASAALAPAMALDAKVDAGVKAFAAVEADAAKIKAYCAMSKTMSTANDETDSAKSEAFDKEISGYMATLGKDFQQAWDLGADLNPDSEDGKAMNTALEKLETKCEK